MDATDGGRRPRFPAGGAGEPKLRVMFVDDEPAVLAGLRASLRKLRHSWDMHFALGGHEAIATLEGGRFDVVVTDMRMPEMTGAALLRLVSERWPQMGRVVLSGHAGGEDAVAGRALAHSFLHKPCDPDLLIDAVWKASMLASKPA